MDFLHTYLRKNIKYEVSSKSVHWERVVPSGQTDMTKLIVAFRNFANAPKNVLFSNVTSPGTFSYYRERLLILECDRAERSPITGNVC